MSEYMYNIISSIPIISSVANAFIIRTFFNQFLGGQTTEECIPKIEALRENQMGSLLGYNIEAELDGFSKGLESILTQKQPVLSSIDTQGKTAQRFWPDVSTVPLTRESMNEEVELKTIVTTESTGLGQTKGAEKLRAQEGSHRDGDQHLRIEA